MEVFKDVVGYEGLYMIGSCGSVYSVRRNKILKPSKDKDGYLHVSLSKNDKQKYCFIHRLVGQAFIPNPDNLPQINHKDEIPWNNCVSNLEWCDAKYNNNYGTHGKTVYQYKDGVLIDVYPSISEAVRNGFDSIKISLCHRGIIKTYMGYQWSYDKKGCA